MSTILPTIVTIITAIIAASAATTGYVLTNRARRNEERAKLFAAALDAVDEYKNLPYRIRRRTKSDPETRSELGTRISDSQQKIRYFTGLLELEGARVAQAYRDLVLAVWSPCKLHREAAWKAPACEDDLDMAFTDSYSYRDENARSRCLIAMLDQLGRGSKENRCALLANGPRTSR